ncbi:MAG: amidohydrolase family protein, partial [Gemmatimonadota bacterium]|nr:amidohydrolase family protein [Gemmatimonadota bacterium]
MPAPINRRTFLKTTGLAAAGIAGASISQITCSRPRFDLVIRGASILDGTGKPAYQADLGITGDTIAALGAIDPGQGKREIQASGFHLCPGFIDIHTHSDRTILAYPEAESRIFQGVTTEITGNCGFSSAPLTGVDVENRREELEEWLNGGKADWSDVDSYLARIEETGSAVNFALLLGQGSLRRNAVGLVDRPLTADELKAVIRAVEEGMEQGAVGLSTGLEYIPGSYTPTGEVVALAKAAARRGGIYATHVRDEGAE